MKLVASVLAIWAVLPIPSAHARDDRIEIYSNQDMSACSLTDTDPFSLQDVYVFHNNSIGATGSRFRVPTPACWTGATHLSTVAAPGFLTIGASQSDMQVFYGACLFNSIYVAQIRFFATGRGPACCQVPALPAPAASPAGIHVLDCDGVPHVALAGTGAIVNPNASCPCNPTPPPPPILPNRGDRISLYADDGMSSCRIVEGNPGIRSIHVFHTGPMPAVAVEFSVPKPACWLGATWVGDTIAAPFLALGNSQSDLTIAYTACRQPPVYLGSINFYAAGGATTCCQAVVRVGAQADPHAVLAVDCNGELALATPGERVVINPDATCDCESPVAAQETTWGRIKAMYSNR